MFTRSPKTLSDTGMISSFIGKKEELTEAVEEFYSKTPFPNYNDFDSIETFIEKGAKLRFFQELSQLIKPWHKFVEVGCGTGQVSNFLSAVTPSEIFGVDLTYQSLLLAEQFAANNNLSAKFIHADIFDLPFQNEAFDVVMCSGVLHHTVNCALGIENVSKLVKKPDKASNGGVLIIGLYNTYGRIWTDLRRFLFKNNDKFLKILDPHLRSEISDEKTKAWINDQYRHPHEEKWTVRATIDKLKTLGFQRFACVPNSMSGFDGNLTFDDYENIDWFDVRCNEFGMLFNELGSEGGLHVVFAKY